MINCESWIPAKISSQLVFILYLNSEKHDQKKHMKTMSAVSDDMSHIIYDMYHKLVALVIICFFIVNKK